MSSQYGYNAGHINVLGGLHVACGPEVAQACFRGIGHSAKLTFKLCSNYFLKLLEGKRVTPCLPGKD